MTHFETTTVAESDCHRCRKPILTALDEGLRARVDAKPLPDRQAEIVALLEGRWTYTLTANNQLWHRDVHRITAGTLRGPIHAEHRCTGAIQLTIDDLFGNIQPSNTRGTR